MANLEISEIRTSISIPSLIKDEFISKGSFVLRHNGEPVMYTGGFTSVFPCVVNGEKWAFRCWHNDLGNVRTRFKKLDDALKNVRIPYLADFKYVDEGIVVNGRIYPTTRMRWIDGCNIKEYICKHRKDTTRLKKLATDFLVMCQFMHEQQFAHGDLQHGNIIVQDDGTLFLIDYDSLYHPSMGAMSDIITGLKDYQHPARMVNNKASEKLDYFSELIIYMCILAVSIEPSLVETYNLESSESMLFTAKDYEYIEQSNLFKHLSSKDEYLEILCGILKEYLSHHSIDELLPLETMLDMTIGSIEISDMEICNESVYEGDTVTLRWNTDKAVKQILNGVEIAPECRHYEFVATKGKCDLMLTVSNFRHHLSKTLTFHVHPLVEIDLSSDKQLIRKGKHNRLLLKWKVKNASEAVLLDGSGKKLNSALAGQLDIVKDDADVFMIVATGGDGKRKFKKEIQVNSAYESIVNFKIDKHFTLPGVPVHLSWDIDHAKSVKIGGKGQIPHRGKLAIETEKDTSIVLIVEDSFGTQTYEEKIRILPLPVIKLKPSAPHISNNVKIRASFVRPNTRVITPKVSAVRAVPFVPHSKIPGIKTSLGLVVPNFSELKIEHSNHGFSTWKSLTNLSNKLFYNLKQTLSRYGK